MLRPFSVKVSVLGYFPLHIKVNYTEICPEMFARK